MDTKWDNAIFKVRGHGCSALNTNALKNALIVTTVVADCHIVDFSM